MDTPQNAIALIDEGLEIFTNLIDSVTRHGNYSAESTCTFIDQGAGAVREARALLAAITRAEPPTGDLTLSVIADKLDAEGRHRHAQYVRGELAERGREPVAWINGRDLRFLREGSYREVKVYNYEKDGDVALTTPPVPPSSDDLVAAREATMWVTVRVEDTCDGLLIHPDDFKKWNLNGDQQYDGHMLSDGRFRLALRSPALPVVGAKPLDLSNLLKHAFCAGFASGSATQVDVWTKANAQWPSYDPEPCPAYARIRSALTPLVQPVVGEKRAGAGE